MEKYRVVLTCWNYMEPKPYADDLSGVALSLFSSEKDALNAVQKSVADELETLNEGRELISIEDSDGNVVGYDYDFRSDESSDHANIVRFWDGEDYQNVTVYDVYKLSGDSDDLEKSSYFKYRGFYVLPNSNRTCFKIEQHDTCLATKHTLDGALKWIDNWCLSFEMGKSKMVFSGRDTSQSLSEKIAVVKNQKSIKASGVEKTKNFDRDER